MLPADSPPDGPATTSTSSNPPTPIVVTPSPGVSFVVRPFPPPSLVDVPVEYVVTQLRKLAPHFWNKTETGDCTIIVPMNAENRFRSRRSSDGGFPSRKSMSEQMNTGVPFTSIAEETSAGRRSSAPIMGEGPRKRQVYKLHRDYLCSQSTFFRSIFSGISPLDPNDPRNPRPLSKLAAGAFPVPPSSQPRLLPCAMNHPQLFLPLPDPASFNHILHYLYFGSIDNIEDNLTRGTISWEGVVRNVEYLGLRQDIKIFLGRWWGQWLDPTRHRRGGTSRQPIIDEEDSEGEEGGDEADNRSHGSSSPLRINPNRRRSTSRASST